MVLYRFCKHDSRHWHKEKKFNTRYQRRFRIDTRFEWMEGKENQFPMKSRNEVIFTSKEVKEKKDEISCSIQQSCNKFILQSSKVKCRMK